MAKKFGVAPLSKDPVAYADFKFTTVPTVDAPRAPNSLDVNYPIQTIWRQRNPNDPSDYCEWILLGFDSTGALWRLFVCTTTNATMLSIETDDGAPNVLPDVAGEVQILGGAGISVTGQGPGNIVTVALTGGGAAIDTVDVDFATGPGVDPVTPDGGGQISVFGNAVANATNGNSPVATHTRALNQFHVDVQLGTALAPTPGDPFDAGLLSMDNTYFSVDGNAFTRLIAPGTDGQLLIGHTVNGVPSQATLTEGANINILNGAGSITISTAGGLEGSVSNLGIAYSSPTFTVQGYDGTALSATNPAMVWMQDFAQSGELRKYKVTANQDFIDDSGASEILNNTFGTTTAAAWSVEMPFYLYAVANSDTAGNGEPEVAFCISRVPHHSTCPAILGDPSSAIADTDGSMWSLEDITEADYTTQPCLCIGAFRMVKSAADDWTVQAINFTDGIGKYHERGLFQMEVLQNGATADIMSSSNGPDTLPTFANSATNYRIDRAGNIDYFFNFNNVSVDGTGTGNIRFHTPLTIAYASSSFACGVYVHNDVTNANWDTAICRMNISATASNDRWIELVASGTATAKLTPAQFTTTGTQISNGSFSIRYPAGIT